MDGKIKFFVILMVFCLASLNTASAYSAYLNIYIVDLNTNTDSDSDPIALVDHPNSPIQWKVSGTGCSNPTSYTNDIVAGEYGNGATIATGSTATLIQGSSCTLYLQVDEVKVGGYYYGSCITQGTGIDKCTTCANAADNCPSGGWITTPTNAYEGSIAHSLVGTGADCEEIQNFGRCSDEIVTQLDEGGTTEFAFQFTA